MSAQGKTLKLTALEARELAGILKRLLDRSDYDEERTIAETILRKLRKKGSP